MLEVRKLLEFDKVVSQIQKRAISSASQSRFTDLPHLTGKAEIELALQNVAELVFLLEHDKAFPLELWDLEDDLSRAAVPGHVLHESALVRVFNTLVTAKRVFSYLRERRETKPKLWAIASRLVRCKEIEQAIPEKIDTKLAEVKSSASPTLAQIRRSISQLEQKSRKALTALNKKYAELGYLQESTLTIKDGKLVLAAKRENKNKIPGLIHDYSGTGQTVFIEPLESLQLSNELQALKAEEQQEINRILRELTAMIHADLDSVSTNFDLLCEFDFIHAKALYAREFGCNLPALNEKNVIEISDGRHPLLLAHKGPKDVVPLNMKLPEKLKTLVITGPNAGGKSVALKTVGLLALMLQAGIPVPASPDSQMAIFENIFADIGDFQSIEDDLSTFSSHVKRIAAILDGAGPKSLVLMDEVGVGTDPAEGSALSISLLEELTARGCKTIVTTHHGNLKAFAYETEGVENASMEFHVDNLMPTYRFKAGIPGSSYALEICKRMGLPEPLLERSRELLGEEKQRLENLIFDLDRKAQNFDKVSQELDIDKLRLQALTNLYEEKIAAIKQHEREAKEKALAEAEEIVAQSNALIEKTIREIREKHATRETIAKAKEQIQEKQKEVRRKREKITKKANPGHDEEPVRIAVGEHVYWSKQRRAGQIVALQEGSDKVLVQFDALKFWVPVGELSQASRQRIEAAKPKTSVKIQTVDKDSVLPAIDVRGHTIEDAIQKVDKFLDDALLAGWQQVRLIHGKGTGALRQGIIAYLEKHVHVKSQQMAAWNEGDLGVTVVELF